MKVRVLMENTSENPELHSEHGLSLYIETAHKRILFDAGQTESFAENAVKMGVRLEDVDLCILSHGHYDHGGGLKRFLQINDHAGVYLHRESFCERYSGGEKYIGLDMALKASDRIVFADDDCVIGDGMRLCTCNEQKMWHPMSRQGLTAVVNGMRVPDDFRHEQYLIMNEGGKRVVFSGCSHKGIRNIVKWLQPDVLVGGFHFMKLDPVSDAEMLREHAIGLLEGNCRYYTGHCTGLDQYDVLKKIMADRLQYISAGSVFEI